MQKLDPSVYQPPLTWPARLVRLGGCFLISGIVWGTLAAAQWEEARTLFYVDLAVGALAYAIVPFRRRWPVGVALVTTVLGPMSALAAGPATLAAVSLFTRRVWWQVVTISVLGVAFGQLFALVQPLPEEEPPWLTLTVNLVLISATAAWGMYIGSRRELLWTLRQRAERAEAEQELRVTQARGTERARIAREMHDVLAHRISQISMHAGALSFRDDLTTEEMQESAGVIQEKAHEALTDLRGVLGVLRDDLTGEPVDAPQPTYADLPHLVDEARQGGLSVELVDALDPDSVVPEAVGRTLYRIIQEGITNARKHAPGAVLAIQLEGSPEDGVDVTMRNPVGFRPTSTPGSGLGLVGLAERVALRGGRLDQHHSGRMFVLHAWIPWAA